MLVLVMHFKSNSCTQYRWAQSAGETFLKLLGNVNMLEMRSHFIFSIARKCTQIAFELFDIQMFLVDVKCQLTVAMQNFATLRTDSLAVIDLLALRQMHVFDVSRDVEFSVCRVITVTALVVFDFGVHSSNVQGNFPPLGELFATDGTLFATIEFGEFAEFNIDEMQRQLNLLGISRNRVSASLWFNQRSFEQNFNMFQNFVFHLSIFDWLMFAGNLVKLIEIMALIC